MMRLEKCALVVSVIEGPFFCELLMVEFLEVRCEIAHKLGTCEPWLALRGGVLQRCVAAGECDGQCCGHSQPVLLGFEVSALSVDVLVRVFFEGTCGVFSAIVPSFHTSA